MAEEIVNKVAKSGLIELDLSELLPRPEIVPLDISDALYEGLVLREKEFRVYVKELDTLRFEHRIVSVFCSADAIVPTWAYMLVATRLKGIAREVYFGTVQQATNDYYKEEMGKLDVETYRDQRLVIKGCSDVPDSAYLYLAYKLTGVVRSVMFGEACSTVPVYKAPKK